MHEFNNSVLNAIGNTPLVEIKRLNPNPKVKIFAKLESSNPGGSVKDRTALFMIEGAEKRGELTPDKIILEATSGNTGIGLAMIAAVKGYKLCLTMSEAASEERKKILRALGAELHFTPANQGTDGAIEAAYKMLRENPGKYFGTDQFNNEDNIAAHYSGTAREIWEQTGGQVTMVVVSIGTSGTVMGISKRLKELNPQVKIIGVEPYLQHKIQGLKNMKESYRPGIFEKNRLDEKVNILDEDAFAMARRLAREEGILAGMSSGAAMHIAVQKALQMEEGVIVVILPDSGERYLSTDLFTFQEELSTLNLYNILSRQRALFKPLKAGEVTLRTCGPTAHDAPHLGNYRRLVAADLLHRYLVYRGYRVKHVLDIMDIGDKSIKGSEKASVELAAYTDKYIKIFLAEARDLNIRQDNIYVRAGENVEEMFKIVEKLVDRNYAYEKLHSVYYDISKLTEYGALTNIDPGKIRRQSKSVDMDDYEKDSLVDFALLKRANLNELKRGVYFKTRWGNIRPGWHLECAAISQKYFGQAYDIHVSGADEAFPHGENILAINRACFGRSGANYWINTEMVMVKGSKMSRSSNTDVALEKLRQLGYSGADIRFLLLSLHYRKPLNYSDQALAAAKNTVDKLNNFISRVKAVQHENGGFAETDQLIYDLKNGFAAALDDDLNIAGALAVLFDFVGLINLPLAKESLSKNDAGKVLQALKEINEVLAVMDLESRVIAADVQMLSEKRNEARAAGRWQEADELRARITAAGYEVLDTAQGAILRLK